MRLLPATVLAFSLFAGAVGLWLAAALFELLQHAVEWELGMFTRGDGIEAGFETQTRMTFGYLKAGAMVVCFYLVPRFMYQDRKWRRVLSYDNALLKGVAVAAGTVGLSMAPSEGLTALAARIDLMDPALEFAWAQLIGLMLTIPLAALLPWSIGLIAGDKRHDVPKVGRLHASALAMGVFSHPCLHGPHHRSTLLVELFGLRHAACGCGTATSCWTRS